MYLPFDQYQRYETFNRVVRKFKEVKNIASLKILEVGANSQKNLGKFLTEEEIYYTDLEVPEEFVNDIHFFAANACDMEEIDDDSYDIVIAGDVFEHIPIALRENFIKEINRVAKYFALISFPYFCDYNNRAEKRANEYFRFFSGEDYVWLKEHIENKLPDRDELEDILISNSYAYRCVCHGDVQIWEMLTKTHFYCTVYSDLIEYRKNIDQYYIDYVYQQDISDECYRSFYIMSKHLKEEELALVVDSLFKKGNIKKMRNRLKEMIDEIHCLAEMKLNVKNNQDIQKNILNYSGVGAYEICQLPCSVYYDYGSGYSEENRHIFSLEELQSGEYISVELGEHVQKLRVDPCEGKYCILTDLHIYDENGNKLLFTTNGSNCDDMIVYDTYDPSIEIDVHSIKNVKLKYRIYIISNIYLNKIIRNYIAYRKKALKNETFRYEDKEFILTKEKVSEVISDSCDKQKYLDEQLQYARLQYSDLKKSYDGIINSAEWRIVRPIFKLLSFIKNLRVCQLLYSFHCVRKNLGIKVAMSETFSFFSKSKKIKEKINVEHNIRYNIFVVHDSKRKCHKLDDCLQSLQSQDYTETGIKVVSDSEISEQINSKYKKVEFIVNSDIGKTLHELLQESDGQYVIICYDNVIFKIDALLKLTLGINETKPEVIYSDEICNGKEYYKPDYSPDLLLSNYYFGDMVAFEANLISNFHTAFKYNEDLLFSIVLETMNKTQAILHVPSILFEAFGDCEKNNDKRKEILQYYLRENAVAEIDTATQYFDVRYCKERTESLVSIIIPTKDKCDLTNDCVQSILSKTIYSNYEILILDNRSEEQESFLWFESIQKQDERVKVIKADFEFNWSKLNNYGMRHARGEVFVFLNNDTLIISEDWLDRLVGQALRPEVGVVGPLLLYDDDTIQHAGVVVGIGGWADHIYKGLSIDSYEGVFVSPLCTRNVTAVTGACMVIAKNVIEKIGEFDEEFIICGSDVEICLRAYEYGYNNVYDAFVRLYHLESKSRDSYIPEVDFKKSYEAYTEFRENGDPYYNINLDLQKPVPTKGEKEMRLDWVLNKLRNNRFAIKAYRYMLDAVSQKNVVSFIAEVQEMKTRSVDGVDNMRINLLVPSVDNRYVFGGISTAYKFFEQFSEMKGIQKRIIVTDDQVDPKTMIDLPGYMIVEPEDNITEGNQIVGMGNRANRTLPVFKNDIFMATSWWSAYISFEILRWQADVYKQSVKKLVYFVQDYEPGFYPWSSRYLMADSTYKSDVPTIAIYNSYILSEYFRRNGYTFANEYYFDPTLNSELKKELLKYKNSMPRKKQILIYGRPSVERNAFELIVDSLKTWCDMQEDIDDWTILSAGEVFDDVPLKRGKKIEVLGKLTLEEYAKTMLQTKVGISLMVSPHPSYPPLEMSTFGVKVITNTYDNKNLNGFNENIIALSNCSGQAIANKLYELCSNSNLENKVVLDGDYVNNDTVWTDIIQNVYENIQ